MDSGAGRLFWPTKKKYIHTFEKFTKYINWQTNDNLRKIHVLLNCTRVVWIINCNVQQYRWRCAGPWSWLQEIKRLSLKRQRPHLLHQNLLTASMHPQNSLPSCCSLLVRINVLKHLAASFNEPKPLSQLRNHHCSLLGLMRRFLAFVKGTLIPNFNKMVARELLIIGVQKWKTSSALHFQTCALGVKWRKCGVT